MREPVLGVIFEVLTVVLDVILLPINELGGGQSSTAEIMRGA